jgi:hypothetical protein
MLNDKFEKKNQLNKIQKKKLESTWINLYDL